MSDNALSALRALQAATGEAGAAGASNLPNIPAVPATDDAALANWMSSVKAWLEAANAAGATGFATKEDLIRAGVLKQDEQGNVAPTVPASAAVPPAPSGLTADGAVESIIVSWNNPLASYGNHAYAEVWAAGDANFTNAVMVGQAAGFMFAHVTGDAAQRWYWVRFVSTSGVKGPFSAVNGVPGASAVDPADVFAAIVGTEADKPFFTLTEATVINGVSVPPGTYIKEAFIAAATISNAMIRDAAIDSAKIANAAIVNAKIQDAAISSAKIALAQILTAHIADAQITGAKIDTATINTANIANAAITTAKIQDGNITTAKIADAQITNAKIVNAAVDTLKIAGNAVTIPISVSGSGSNPTISTPWADFYGMPVVLMVFADVGTVDSGSNTFTFSRPIQFYMDGGLIAQRTIACTTTSNGEGSSYGYLSGSAAVIHTPPGGAHYFGAGFIPGQMGNVNSLTLIVIGLKR